MGHCGITPGGGSSGGAGDEFLMTFRRIPKFVSIESETTSLPDCMNATKNSYDNKDHDDAALLGLPGGNILICGGANFDKCYEYDVTADSYEEVGTLTMAG